MAVAVDTLRINRWQLDWLLTAEPSRAAFAARSMADDVVKLLPECLARITLNVPTGPDAIVFIDRLTLDREIGAAWSRESIAERVAARLAQQLSRGLASGELGVVFRDRAEFLACFVVDSHAGRARGDWRYAEFEGVAALPFSSALRTLAEARPAEFHEALKRLDAGAVERVLGAVNDVDAGRILALHEGGQAVADLSLLESALATLAGRAELSRAAVSAGARLTLVVHLARAEPAVGVREIVAAVTALGALRSVLDADPAAMRDPIACLAALAHRAPAVVARLAPVFARDPDGAAALLARVAPDSDTQDALEHPHLTPFGGALMLLGLIDDLRLRFDTLGDHAATSGHSLARLLLVAHALGSRAPEVFADAVLRTLLGIPDSLTFADAHAWCVDLDESAQQTLALEELTADLRARDAPAAHPGYGTHFPPEAPAAVRQGATVLLRAFAFRFGAFGGSSPAFLLRNFLTASAHVGQRRGHWVARVGAVTLDSVLRVTRFRSLCFETGRGGARVQLEEAG